MADIKEDEKQVDHFESDEKAAPVEIQQANAELYHESLIRYPDDESIDAAEEKRVLRKIDRRILPVLGVCYFFYVRIFACCPSIPCEDQYELTRTAVNVNFSMSTKQLYRTPPSSGSGRTWP